MAGNSLEFRYTFSLCSINFNLKGTLFERIMPIYFQFIIVKAENNSNSHYEESRKTICDIFIK
jgi:hypothetical protein